MTANNIVWIHLVTATFAVFFGLLNVFIRKGTSLHRNFGYTWIALILIASLSSFFIRRNNTFSELHLLSIVTIISVTIGLYAIRNGKRQLHARCMIGPLIGAIVAGYFAIFIPGRFAYQLLFGS